MSQLIAGTKKGEKAPRQPIIAPDSAKSIDYFKILYALTEGEIVRTVDGLHSIMLDGAPIQYLTPIVSYLTLYWKQS